MCKNIIILWKVHLHIKLCFSGRHLMMIISIKFSKLFFFNSHCCLISHWSWKKLTSGVAKNWHLQAPSKWINRSELLQNCLRNHNVIRPSSQVNKMTTATWTLTLFYLTIFFLECNRELNIFNKERRDVVCMHR